MGIKIIRGGMRTTVQDLGRFGYQSSGFSVSGVMDRRSAVLANYLVGNDIGAPVLECILTGPEIEFTKKARVAITGGDFMPVLNGIEIESYQAFIVQQGDILHLKYAKTGSYGYIAIGEKLDIPMSMGSRSTNTKIQIGGFKGRAIRRGDFIAFVNNFEVAEFFPRSMPAENFDEKHSVLRVVLGPEEDAFTEKGIQTFLSKEYQLSSEIDRMGYRLKGEKIEHKGDADIITNAIAFGAVQVPSEGNPIIMLADRQTTGGYVKIATVLSVDIPKLIQKKTGDKVSFKEITVEEAQLIYREEMMKLEKIKKALDFTARKKNHRRFASERIAELLV